MRKLLLTAAALCGFAGLAAAQVPTYVPSNGLLAWWGFTGNANDLSGNGHNAMATNASLSTDRRGNPNAAYVFNGSSNYIDIPDAPALRLNNTDFTVSLWANTYAYNGNAIFSKRGSGPYNGYLFNSSTFVGNQLQYIASGGVAPRGYMSGVPSTNNWHHIVVVYRLSAQTVSFYQDGVLINTTTGVDNNGNPVSGIPTPVSTCTANLRFGGDSQGQPYWHDGKLDDIGMWGRALSQQEITNLYNANTNGLDELLAENLFSVYPNPTSDQVLVKADTKLLGHAYHLFDNTGKVVLVGKFNALETVLDLSRFPKGIYLFSIGENLQHSFKVAKE